MCKENFTRTYTRNLVGGTGFELVTFPARGDALHTIDQRLDNAMRLP